MGDVDYRTLMFRLIRASSFAAEDCYGSETMGRRDDAERAVTTYVESLRAAVRAADAFFAGWKAGDRMQWESAYAEYMAARAALDAKEGE